MILSLDTEAKTLTVEEAGAVETLPLYSPRAFELLSLQWVRTGWGLKYSYNFSWMGRPIIQTPEDMVRMQEVLYRVRPDVIIETGVAHGGSLIYYASLCQAWGRGRVIGIDVDIRPHNLKAIQNHEMASLITLEVGSSIDPEVVGRVERAVQPQETVLVILDSCHTRQHVADELEAYHRLVTPGSYLVANDGIMRNLHDVPGGERHWANDNPCTAAAEFAALHPEFVLEQPPWPFSESDLQTNVTYWPDAWLRRL